VLPAGTGGGTHQPLAPGTILQGHYRIERVLGSGAFGRVYLATDTQDAAHPSVAIKEMLDHQFASPADKRWWLAGTIKRDEWNGGNAAEMHVEDAALA